MKTNELFTIGYEGRNIGEFISHLKDFNITRLIDVRKIPLSRKKGFNKKPLENIYILIFYTAIASIIFQLLDFCEAYHKS